MLDKDEVAGDFTLCAPTVVGPTQAVFDESANWAGAHAVVMTAKAIMRDEPWSVMMRDADFKVELLRMIEWDHILRYGSSRDVRYLGTQMRSWMDIGGSTCPVNLHCDVGADNRDASLQGSNSSAVFPIRWRVKVDSRRFLSNGSRPRSSASSVLHHGHDQPLYGPLT
ncbi:hypothetical protein GS909_23535 [Rhodococcus hoagii]|nr:hypothetical protein [Prescottella equi]